MLPALRKTSTLQLSLAAKTFTCPARMSGKQVRLHTFPSLSRIGVLLAGADIVGGRLACV